MAAEDSAGESKIGKGTRISGKLNFAGPVRIDGELDGEINADEITIASGASVNARIAANKVAIAGIFTGEVTARERVELQSTARAKCTISTPVLMLAEGAQFDGDCRMPRAKLAAA